MAGGESKVGPHRLGSGRWLSLRHCPCMLSFLPTFCAICHLGLQVASNNVDVYLANYDLW